MIEQQQREAVLAEARSWLRTPYHHHEHIKGAGVDCAFLLIEVYAAAGMIEWFDPGYYPQDVMLHRGDETYLAWLEKYGHEVETPQPGDAAVWQFGRSYSHGAIVLAWPQIIHAYRTQGCVLGEGGQGDLAGRKVKFYSLWGNQ